MTESDFNIQEYLSEGVEIIVKDAMRATLKNPKESIYLLKFSKYARKATKIRQEYEKNGQNIPAFLIASITSSCNLHCTGCYSRANDGANAYPCIFLNGNLTEVQYIMSVVEIVINSSNFDFWPNQHVVFYYHPARREYGGTFIDNNVFSYCHTASAIAIEWRYDSNTIIYFTLEKFF